MALIALAGLLLNASLASFLGRVSRGACAARQWGVSLATTLFVAALALKMLRVIKIHRAAKQMKKAHFGFYWLVARVALLVGVDAAILASWNLAAPYRPHALHTLLPDGTRATVEVCASIGASAWRAWFADFFKVVSGLYKVAIVLYSCKLAWLARDFHAKFVESRAILVAAYTVLLSALLLVLALAVARSTPNAAALLLVAAVAWWAAAVVLVALFGFRVAHLLREGDIESVGEFIYEVVWGRGVTRRVVSGMGPASTRWCGVEE